MRTHLPVTGHSLCFLGETKVWEDDHTACLVAQMEVSDAQLPQYDSVAAVQMWSRTDARTR